MLSAIVAVAAFAPPAARTSPHTAVQPLRAAQPLCKVRDPDDKVIYVGASLRYHTPSRPASHKRSHPASRTAIRTAKPSPSATAP
jgi:hypothetical protein